MPYASGPPVDEEDESSSVLSILQLSLGLAFATFFFQSGVRACRRCAREGDPVRSWRQNLTYTTLRRAIKKWRRELDVSRSALKIGRPN